MKKFIFFLFFLYLNTFNTLTIASTNKKYIATPIAKIEGIPWSFLFMENNLILVASRDGYLHLIDMKKSKVIDKTQVPNVADVGQGGLLDLKKHPKFSTNSLIFFTFSTKLEKGFTTALGTFEWKKNRPKNFKTIFIANAYGKTTRHFGSRLAFNKLKNNIFLSVGDRGEREKAQDLNFHHGKILRLNLDGTTVSKNPFKNAPAIWSLGHRNPQGLFYDEMTETLFEQEHGPRGGDEINIIKKGKNYGWPIITYGKEYWGPSIGEGTAKKGLEQPIKYYVPSIAPCGLILYRADQYPEWKGSLFSGALKLRHLNRVSLHVEKYKKTLHFKAGNEERLFKKLNKRVRYITTDDKQWLYFSTDNGEIYRIDKAI